MRSCIPEDLRDINQASLRRAFRDDVYPILQESIAEKHKWLDTNRRFGTLLMEDFEQNYEGTPDEFSPSGISLQYSIREWAEKCKKDERVIKNLENAIRDYFTEEIPERRKMTELLVDEARDVPLEEIATQFGVQLKKAGRQLRGLCPFHEEKTPSFFIDSTKNLWHCQGCHLGGDSIRFIEKIRQCNFVDAVKFLTL